MKTIICTALLFLAFSLAAFEITGDTHAWEIEDFFGFDEVGENRVNTGDITSVFGRVENNQLYLRVSFDDMVSRANNHIVSDRFFNENIIMNYIVSTSGKQLINETVNISENCRNTDNYVFYNPILS